MPCIGRMTLTLDATQRVRKQLREASDASDGAISDAPQRPMHSLKHAHEGG